jgi:hypothetical protein
MKKNTNRSVDEGYSEALAQLENESPDKLPDSEPTASTKSSSGCLRRMGILFLIVSILGLLFASPMLEGIPLIATIRIPLEIFGLLDTLSQLPSLLWILLLLVALLCLRKKSPKSAPSSSVTTNSQPGSKHWSLGSSVESWDAGLKPEVADLSMKRYEELRRSCSDVFVAAPGIRMMNVIRSRNSQVYEEKVFHWVPDGDHYSIMITEPKKLSFTLDSHGKVIGVAYANGIPYPFPMKYHIPHPIARENKDNDTIVNCYITLLGGL